MYVLYNKYIYTRLHTYSTNEPLVYLSTEGITGKILESKGGRDFAKINDVPYEYKVAGWLAIGLMNAGMMFYILLFAISQTETRQNQWFQSFVMYLILEILFISTLIVFVTHVIVPGLAMKDVNNVKQRLQENMQDFRKSIRIQSNSRREGSSDLVTVTNSKLPTSAVVSDPALFNAAKYLFLSNKLAMHHSDVREAKVIMQFSTPWPRVSYHHTRDVAKGYSKKFSALTKSASVVVFYFISNVLTIPVPIQDMIAQIVGTLVVGYTVVIHIQLFNLFPLFALIPFFVLLVIAHFAIMSGQAEARRAIIARTSDGKGKDSLLTAGPTAKLADTNKKSREDKYKEKNDEDDEEVGGKVSVSRMAQGTELVGRENNRQTEQEWHNSRKQSLVAGVDVVRKLQMLQQKADEDTDYSESSEDDSDDSDDSDNSDESDDDSEEGSEDEDNSSINLSFDEEKAKEDAPVRWHRTALPVNRVQEKEKTNDDLPAAPPKHLAEFYAARYDQLHTRALQVILTLQLCNNMITIVTN